MIVFLNVGDVVVQVVFVVMGFLDCVLFSDVIFNVLILVLGKILVIGLNYVDYIKELGMDILEYQIWFNKQRNFVYDLNGLINKLVVFDFFDYEVELCFVVGKRCKYVFRECVFEVIGGYFIGNDVSVCDW